jgi:hypothetical protein
LNHPEIKIATKEIAEINHAISDGLKISLITYVLGNMGEAKLKYILDRTLLKYGRQDLMELFYTAAKELIANSTKAAIKRMIFQEMGLNIQEEVDYRKGMERFKSYLNERKFPAYRSKMKENNYFIKITISHSPRKMSLSVINNFSLIPIEEERVKEKFQHAKKYDNLFEFFMAHGDNSEGAGMGITMVEILLSQSGFDRNNFIVLSSDKANITIAKVEIPLISGDTLPMAYNGQQVISDSLTLKEIKEVLS